MCQFGFFADAGYRFAAPDPALPPGVVAFAFEDDRRYGVPAAGLGAGFLAPPKGAGLLKTYD